MNLKKIRASISKKFKLDDKGRARLLKLFPYAIGTTLLLLAIANFKENPSISFYQIVFAYFAYMMERIFNFLQSTLDVYNQQTEAINKLLQERDVNLLAGKIIFRDKSEVN